MIKIRPAVGVDKWIDEHRPKWRERAAELASRDLADGRYKERDKIWSRLKPFFIEAQAEKCGYCESHLGSNGVEWEIEHYRPKSRVLTWQPGQPLDFKDQPQSDRGYYQLAYHPGNYVASCGSCNGPKHDYFPVFAGRQLGATDSRTLTQEKPLIINPIDADDEDPEDLIEFDGPVPQPRFADGPARIRALATIELFRLQDEKRVYDRSIYICLMWHAYSNRDDPGEQGRRAREDLADAAKPRMPHSSCIRSFLGLCETSQEDAKNLADCAEDIVFRRVRPVIRPPD